MSFESGSVSMRVFKVAGNMPDDTLSRFRGKAVQPAEDITSPSVGWATGRHMLDRVIEEESAVVAGRLRLCLTKVEKRIPSSLFKVERRQEELAAMAAAGVGFLKRDERIRISKEVRERLLPKMPLSISGIDVVVESDRGSPRVYATASSDSKSDMLMASFQEAVGLSLHPVGAVSLARDAGVDPLSIKPSSFAPNGAPDMDLELGDDFLSWVWFASENKDGAFEIVEGGHKEFASILLEGPMTLVHEGNGAHEAILRKGAPTISREAKTAMLSSKKLRRAKLTLVVNKEQWSTSFDARTWTFGGLKVPPSPEKLDGVSMFEHRIMAVARFMSIVENIYGRFLGARKAQASWDAEVEAFQQWLTARPEQV